MIKFMYSILDLKTKGFSPCMLEDTDASATRTFTRETQNPESLLGTNTEDFVLYRLGQFNTNTGILQGNEPELVVAGKDLNPATVTPIKQEG